MRSSYLLLATLVPFVILDIWYTGIFLLWGLKVSVITYFIVFGCVPIVFHYSTWLQQKILFLNFVKWPMNVNLSQPESVGLVGVRNFYITTDEGVTLGAWQLLPQSILNQTDVPKSDEEFEQVLRNAQRPVFLYMHGNSGNRAGSHRLELYQLFQKLDFHVVCFDYRSYGDSDPIEANEVGIVSDSKFMLQWLMKLVNGSSPIFVWGHSLGTGVSSHVLGLLADEGIQPNGLFLESPFNKMADELREHPFAQLFRHLPWFDWMVVQPFQENNLKFESDQHIKKIKCPVMILHAEDDTIVPFALGVKLYEAGLKAHNNDTSQIQMVRISAAEGLGHKYICRYKELPNIIRTFVLDNNSSKQTLMSDE